MTPDETRALIERLRLYSPQKEDARAAASALEQLLARSDDAAKFGFTMGARWMRERAARVCEETYPEMRGVGEIEQLPCYDTPAECAAAIRALEESMSETNIK